jgi:hypothetical protein
MKRLLTITLFALGAFALFGCPVWSDSHDNCYGRGQCYNCPSYSTNCGNTQCTTNADCPNGELCDNTGTCVSSSPPNSCTSPGNCPSGENCGSDNQCHAGDCSNSGCPSGYVCKLSNGTLACVSTGTPPPGDAGADAPPFTGCTSDNDCTADAGTGAKCLDGQCVPPANQCSDTTQCPNNEQCVQGVCTPSCNSTHPCPDGYSCDSNTGVCDGNPSPCGSGSDGGTCTAPNTTCVDQHCVDVCGPNNTCPSGLICVDNGCIPDQKPQFVCNTEGVQDSCAAGSICLHHSCYIACDPDAGANACKTADQFNVCKQVTTSTGTYSVCGSTTNLGSDCDPTQNKNCTSPLICIDGYCR